MDRKVKVIKELKRDGVGVLQTDTIYGLVAKALSPTSVEKIYKIKGRPKDKPFIILIATEKDLQLFNISLSAEEKKIIQKYWPGPVSIILPCPEKKFHYLHRGKKSLAFRLPKKQSLQKILKETGPLVAPSANLSNDRPVENLNEAREVFGSQINFYYGRKPRKQARPSKIISISKGHLDIIRP